MLWLIRELRDQPFVEIMVVLAGIGIRRRVDSRGPAGGSGGGSGDGSGASGCS